jgi:hypothetical protein
MAPLLAADGLCLLPGEGVAGNWHFTCGEIEEEEPEAEMLLPASPDNMDINEPPPTPPRRPSKAS